MSFSLGVCKAAFLHSALNRRKEMIQMLFYVDLRGTQICDHDACEFKSIDDLFEAKDSSGRTVRDYACEATVTATQGKKCTMLTWLSSSLSR